MKGARCPFVRRAWCSSKRYCVLGVECCRRRQRPLLRIHTQHATLNTHAMLLTLDIGNTEITIGAFEGETLSGRWRITTNPDRTPDEWANTLAGFLLHA